MTHPFQHAISIPESLITITSKKCKAAREVAMEATQVILNQVAWVGVVSCVAVQRETSWWADIAERVTPSEWVLAD